MFTKAWHWVHTTEYPSKFEALCDILQHATYSQQEAVSFIHNLKMQHAMETRDQHRMANLNIIWIYWFSFACHMLHSSHSNWFNMLKNLKCSLLVSIYYMHHNTTTVNIVKMFISKDLFVPATAMKLTNFILKQNNTR
jgi:hypothetical protein